MAYTKSPRIASRMSLGLLASATCITFLGACTPPPAATVVPPTVSPLTTDNPWDPIPTSDSASFPEWVQELFPLPAGRPYGSLEVTEDSFSGEWDLAAAGTGEASRYSTRLRYAQWRELSRTAVAGTTTIGLVSPDGKTELTITSVTLGSLERLKIVAKRALNAGT